MSLLPALRRYLPHDAREREHREAMLRLADAGLAALRRDHFSPGHFTASAFVLSPDEAEIALIFHPKLRRWLQPGGHLEPQDADPLAAARREVAEEIGLSELTLLGEGLFDLDVHEIPASSREPAHLHHDLRFLFRAPARVLQGEHAARWVPLAEVSAVESDASVMRAVSKILQRG